MKIALLNDTSASNHFGCKLTVECMLAGFAYHGMDVVCRVPLGADWREYPVDEVDLVVVNGEGSIHHGNHRELVEVALHHRAVLINAVWDSNPLEFSDLASEFLFRFVRESLSKSQLHDSAIVPDMTFYARIPPAQGGSDILDNLCDCKMPLETAIGKASRCRAASTSCLHWSTLLAMLRVPFAGFGANTHKIAGLLADMDQPHLYGGSPPDQFPQSMIDYVVDAPSRIDAMFETIKSL